MTTFDFVVSDEFRESLEADYGEIEAGLAHGAWKAVHVLAGSVIEALLVDYLVASDFEARRGADPLKMDLAKVIAACTEEGILSKKASELSSVVRGYRNLIHPARLIRLNESVDENGARIAKTLVDIIVTEVARASKVRYGLTAQQLLAKLERDPSSLAIVGSLLKDLSRSEIRRLLLQTIPQRFFEETADEDTSVQFLRALSACFRTAFESADEELKHEVTAKFVRVLREESELVVLSYESYFFRGADLEYVEEAVRPLVIGHVLARAKDSPSTELLNAMSGMLPYISDAELSELVDVAIRNAVFGNSALKKAGRALLLNEWIYATDEREKSLKSRVAVWREHFESRSEDSHKEIVESIIDEMEVPF